jgi:hypothetical protein
MADEKVIFSGVVKNNEIAIEPFYRIPGGITSRPDIGAPSEIINVTFLKPVKLFRVSIRDINNRGNKIELYDSNFKLLVTDEAPFGVNNYTVQYTERDFPDIKYAKLIPAPNDYVWYSGLIIKDILDETENPIPIDPSPTPTPSITPSVTATPQASVTIQPSPSPRIVQNWRSCIDGLLKDGTPPKEYIETIFPKGGTCWEPKDNVGFEPSLNELLRYEWRRGSSTYPNAKSFKATNASYARTFEVKLTTNSDITVTPNIFLLTPRGNKDVVVKVTTQLLEKLGDGVSNINMNVEIREL